MALVCVDCGSTNVVSDAQADEDWYSILVTLSDQVPNQEHCEAWMDAKGYGDEMGDAVAVAMHSSLRYDLKKRGWVYNGKPRYDIWRIYQTWMGLEARRNGHKLATPKAPRARAKVGAITRADDGLWNKALGAIQLKVTRPSYETWLKDTVGLGIAGNTLVVGVPNEMVSEMLEMRMYSLIQQAVQDQAGSNTDVVFQVQA